MPAAFKFAAPIFAFGLVAFGFLGMGPVTIAVDSYGPVTDNAQSVYELSQIEGIKNVKQQIKTDFGFDADFENAKYQLEKGDGAGNTFKATAKPVLIGTAVVGATTMVFGIIMLLENMFGGVVTKLSIVQPEIILGLIMGGAVIYWFTGASCQAVVTGAYRAVVYIKEHMKLDSTTASEKDSKEVVRICTVYAQKGMWNIFIVIFCFALALPFFNPYFFIGYLIGIAFFGLFQAIFMANAGGAWDNAKKIVEVDLRQKGTDLHAATVVGDTVGDPFKDTSSVAMNPVIKFTTLFGLLAVEIAVTMKDQGLKTGIGIFFFLVALCFVYRSFYGMRIPRRGYRRHKRQPGPAAQGPSRRGGPRPKVVTAREHLESPGLAENHRRGGAGPSLGRPRRPGPARQSQEEPEARRLHRRLCQPAAGGSGPPHRGGRLPRRGPGVCLCRCAVRSLGAGLGQGPPDHAARWPSTTSRLPGCSATTTSLTRTPPGASGANSACRC